MASVLIFAASALLLAGCSKNAEQETSGSNSSSASAEHSEEQTETAETESAELSENAVPSSAGDIYQTEYGQFAIPEGWVINEEHSTDEKPFFVSEDYDGSGVPDNISVEYGTNHYTKEQAADFGRAILQQLDRQVGSDLNGSITSSGTTTQAGDPVLTFNVPLSDRDCTQYYIVGDNCYVMVYETNIDGSASCDSAAQTIVNTFTWQ